MDWLRLLVTEAKKWGGDGLSWSINYTIHQQSAGQEEDWVEETRQTEWRAATWILLFFFCGRRRAARSLSSFILYFFSPSLCTTTWWNLNNQDAASANNDCNWSDWLARATVDCGNFWQTVSVVSLQKVRWRHSQRTETMFNYMVPSLYAEMMVSKEKRRREERRRTGSVSLRHPKLFTLAG